MTLMEIKLRIKALCITRHLSAAGVMSAHSFVNRSFNRWIAGQISNPLEKPARLLRLAKELSVEGETPSVDATVDGEAVTILYTHDLRAKDREIAEVKQQFASFYRRMVNEGRIDQGTSQLPRQDSKPFTHSRKHERTSTPSRN
jgi:hypothetical protein